MASGGRWRLLRVGCRQSVSQRRWCSGGGAVPEQHLVPSPYGRQQLPRLSITEFVWSRLEQWPRHTAVECSATGLKYEFSQLRKMSRDFGAGLVSDQGLKAGDVVALVLPNCPEYHVTILGSMEAGLVVSPVNPTYGPDEIRHQVSDSGARVVLCHPSKVEDVKTACPHLPVIPVGQGSTALQQMVESGAGKSVGAPPSPDSVAILPYSSGTTGLPKGVVLTHHNIVSNVIQFDHPRTRLPLDTTKEMQEVTTNVLPFFHIYGFTVGLVLYLYKGAKMVTVPRFEPQSFIDTLTKHKPSILHLVPPLIQFLANHPGVTSATLDSIRMVSNGAAPLSPAQAERLLAKKNLTLLSGYGLTETSPAICTCPNDTTDVVSVGHVVSNSDLKIVDPETGHSLDPTSDGEVCVRGPQVMKGYLGNDEATRATVKDGWLHTGDVGHIGPDGKLYLVDRLKELIKVKGFQVAPVELEKVLVTHPDVADCGVVGAPNERTGETPVAFVVRRKGPVEQKELVEYVASRVSSPHKRVTRVVFVDAIPRNASGKILRKTLRQMLA